jgi:holo-[acyl-carrier protein] synthase
MIVGIGTDIVENERIALIYEKFGSHFLDKIYTEEEVYYAKGHSDPVPYLAVRFAAKEAAVKSLNLTEKKGLSFRDIEVRGRIHGKKKIQFYGKILTIAEGLSVNRVHLSMTHTREFSMAVVILENI